MDAAGQTVSVVENGQMVDLKVTLPVRGKLVLFDYNADEVLTQLYPNPIEAAGSWPVREAGETVFLAKDIFGELGLQAGPPLGPQSMIAMVVPEDARLPVVRTALREQQTVRGLFRIAAVEAERVPDSNSEAETEAAPQEPKLAMGVLNYCIDSRICGADTSASE